MDDVSLICTNTSSVPRISNILEKYCTATGAVINKSKSEVYVSKNWQVDRELSDMYPVKKDKIKILGLIFKNSSGAQSWTVAINQVRKKIGGWSTRSLTMTGRVLITKSILFPILSYVGKIFPPDRTTKTVVDRIIYRFIWGSKMERVKPTRREVRGSRTLCSSPECRGSRKPSRTSRPWTGRFADTAKMSTETVLYGPAGGIATSTAKCVWRVINVVKQILWEGRNICVYHKQELNTITTTRRAQTLIKDFVILDIRTLGKDKACPDWRIVGLQNVKME
ncbi:UNVERIFIED_CONTAM: hypothetical protein FKN15_049357 [Acipenser sinensis]